MPDSITEIFTDKNLVAKIQKRLPYLYQIAELESSRAGRTGMEVGSVRERIIVALLVYKFGEQNIETEIPITEPEVDVKLFGKPVSIKTITVKGNAVGGVKLVWTVDAQKSREFLDGYYPRCDILLAQIKWNDTGGFYHIPTDVQKMVFDKIGRENYIKLPKAGTNPRGAEITKEALTSLLADKQSHQIPINWQRSRIDFNPYKRWIDFWKED